MAKTVVMTGGGTGGHLAIIKAVKDAFGNDVELIYIGSTKGQDKAWFENDDSFAYRYFLNTKGVANRSIFGKIDSLYDILKATRESIRILKKHSVDAVFSVGGYSSAPAGISSKIVSIPLIIHEQNAILGSLNKILKPYSCRFLSSFENSSIPYPIKDIFFQKARVRDSLKSIFFLGGSQGAVAINRLALSMAKDLDKKGIKIIHQAGKKNIDEVKSAYEKLQIEATVFGFSDKIDSFMSEADFAIARAGASTLWELSANGVPTLFIPYPYAFADHQFFNAKYLVDKNLAWVMRENEIELKKVWEILESDIEKVSRDLIDFTPKNGSKEIAKAILECIEQ